MLRIGGQYTRRRSKVDAEVRASQIGQQAGQTVVIAEFEFTHGNRVVLIDYGQHAPVQQFRKGVAGVEKALSSAQIVAGEQHLRRRHTVGVKGLVPGAHQLPLPHSGGGLTGGQARGIHMLPMGGQGRAPRCHRAGGNQHHAPRFGQPRHGQGPQSRQLRGQIRKHGDVKPVSVSQYGAAHLDHYNPGLGQSAGAFFPPIGNPRHKAVLCGSGPPWEAAARAVTLWCR